MSETVDIERSLLILGSARSLVIRKLGARMVLGFRPFISVSVRRKDREAFSEMLIRLAQKALDAARRGVATSTIMECRWCGKLKQCKPAKLCPKCRKELQQIKREIKESHMFLQ